MKITEWLTAAIKRLASARIPSARLDAELLILHIVKKDKSWLRAHDDETLTDEQLKQLEKMIARRLARAPLAYITETKEFYGRSFYVTQDVLVPRPETEIVIECLANLQPKAGQQLLDIGTGSGIIAVTAKLEWPALNVTGADISPGALAVARRNARQLKAGVTFIKSDLLSNIPSQSWDFITANLPYVDQTWELPPELRHEPAVALFTYDDGLALVNQLLPQAQKALSPHGFLLLELDQRQHGRTIQTAQAHQFSLIEQAGLILVFQRRP